MLGKYSQWNSHLIGIMISKTIGFRGTQHFQTHPHIIELNCGDKHNQHGRFEYYTRTDKWWNVGIHKAWRWKSGTNQWDMYVYMYIYIRYIHEYTTNINKQYDIHVPENFRTCGLPTVLVIWMCVTVEISGHDDTQRHSWQLKSNVTFETNPSEQPSWSATITGTFTNSHQYKLVIKVYSWLLSSTHVH